jgi:type VI secretion system protein ImpH
MAAASRGRNTGVAQRLFDEPTRFEFFQAVRVLRSIRARARTQTPASADDLDQIARFRARLSLEFPASDIHALRRADGDAGNGEAADGPAQMTVAFMGLTGPSGVLPRHYTEMLIARRARNKDTTARDFFDLFNHRLISLFYQAWEKYRFHVRYERGDRGALTQYLLSLAGLGTRGLQSRLQRDGAGIHDDTLAYYSGLLAKRPRCVASLQALLADHFGAAVQVEQFQGRWLSIAASDRTRLGVQHGGAGLGEGAVLGDRVWDRQSKIRIKFGPLCWRRFGELLPTGSAFAAANQLVRLFAGPSVEYEMQLVLKADQVPAFQLSSKAADAPRLGWSIWLKNQPLTADAAQAVFARVEA